MSLGANLGLGLGWLAAGSFPCSCSIGGVARPCHPCRLKAAPAFFIYLFIYFKFSHDSPHHFRVGQGHQTLLATLHVELTGWVPH